MEAPSQGVDSNGVPRASAMRSPSAVSNSPKQTQKKQSAFKKNVRGSEVKNIPSSSALLTLTDALHKAAIRTHENAEKRKHVVPVTQSLV